MNRLLLSICILLLLPPASATTIIVQPGGKVTSITQAIAMANAGDTIRVKGGIYREGTIHITKPIVLIGEDKPSIDGENKVEVITLEARHVTITGFKILNSGVASMKDLAGIGGMQADFATITKNEFINTFFGVHLSASNYCKVENNTFRAAHLNDHESGNGIHLWQCANATIKDNLIQGHRDGIYFEFVTNSFITGNISEGNHRYGLHFMFSNDDEYRNNVFRNNGAGVAVMYSSHVTMIHNHFDHNWGSSAYALLLKDIRDSRVEGNLFTKNTIGIYMEGSSRSAFERNVFSGNGFAIKLQASCDDNTFTENNFQSNTFDLATNGTVVLNTLTKNYWDKYQGYDLNRDGIGDIAFRPVNMYAMIVERIPTAVLLWRSFLVFLLDRAERVLPVVTPENLKDDFPMMKPYDLDTEP